MSGSVAALAMYDWPETRAATDALWRALAAHLRREGLDAPERLARRNADLPAVPGGISGADGDVIAPDPATLPADGLDMRAVWLHPDLLVAQTCWGPLQGGLDAHVRVVAQPSYDGVPGGDGGLYSSAIVMRRGEGASAVAPPADGGAAIPWLELQSLRFAYNAPDSMSGAIALRQDLAAMGKPFPDLGASLCSGSHRESVRAVAAGQADFAAIDCRSWQMAREFEPAAAGLVAVGWTARRKGLPMITSRRRGEEEAGRIAAALARALSR